MKSEVNTMTFSDLEKMKRLRDCFDLNYRVSRLYAQYLEHYPELICREMIDALCGDGDMSREEAIVAILTEAFALDYDEASDRKIIRDYLVRSVRMLDSKKYTENPYYKNIKVDNIRSASWEFKRESYAPYRAVVCDDMEFFDGFFEVAPLGFFEEEFSFPAVLEGGNEWMTLTPVDLDTCEDAIAKAHGRVITFGLGLGYFAYMASRKAEVESVTVIEKSEEIIKLFSEHILPQFESKDKIRIINADAFEYAEKIMPSEEYDYAFVDTWRDASDGAPMYKRMKALERLSPCTKFDYWVEGFLVSRLRAIKFEELWGECDKDKATTLSYDEICNRLKWENITDG